MICFRKDDDDRKNKKIKKIQDLLDILYEEVDYSEDDSYINSDLSELLRIAYDILFLQNKKVCQFTIYRKKNNSLNIKINRVE